MAADWVLNIDVTDTLAVGNWTGIQRIVRNIAQNAKALSTETGVPVRLIAALGGHYHDLTPAGMERLFQPPSAGESPTLRNKPWKRALGSILYGLPKIFTVLQAWDLERRYTAALARQIEPIVLSFGRKDLIFLPDAFFLGNSSLGAAKSAKRQGAQVVALVHDVIPITHPDTMVPAMRITFPGRIRRAAMFADVVLTYSRDCAASLRRFLGPSFSGLQVETFRLGNDFVTPDRLTGRSARKDGAFGFLMVGTIEPRKGHLVALAAFERLWAAGSPDSLTFVGRIGWLPPEQVERLRSHPENGRRLTLIHGASDQQLADELAACDALIMASMAEGFGLPLIEALAADKPVLASDIGVFREIAGDHVLYFDHEDADDMVRAVRAFEADPARYRALAEQFKWVTWRESTREALAILHRVASTKPAV